MSQKTIPALRISRFSMDCYDTEIDGTYAVVEFPGFTRNIGWNGWATPSFTFEQAMLIVQRNNEMYPDQLASYDPELDTFFFPALGAPEMPPDASLGVEESVYGTPTKLYAIGAFNWTWEERGVHYAREGKPQDGLIFVEARYGIEQSHAYFVGTEQDDGDTPHWPCFDDRTWWSGGAVPFFELPVAREVAAYLTREWTREPQHGEFYVRYDAERDGFIEFDDNMMERPILTRPKYILVAPGDIRKVYVLLEGFSWVTDAMWSALHPSKA